MSHKNVLLWKTMAKEIFKVLLKKTSLYVLIIVLAGIILWKDYVTDVVPDASTIRKYQNEASTRAALIKKYKSLKEFGFLYNILVPEVFCQDLVRIGKVEDGGKWVCNPNRIMHWWSSDCVIYSLGMNNDPSFEEDFQSFVGNRCKLRCIDKDDQSLQTLEAIKNGNGIFKKGFVGAKKKKNNSMNIVNLVDLMKEFGDERIDILKIDIEGFEFEILHQLTAIPICQILIEIHSYTSNRTLEFLQTLSRSGFYLFSYEINGFFPHLCEYSFIHESCLSDFNVKTIYGKFLS